MDVMEDNYTNDVNKNTLFVGFVVGSLIFFFGVICNIINIIVFLKQGLRHVVNISMFAIAVSDIGSLITFQLWNIIVTNDNLFYKLISITDIIADWPHACFLQITIFITTYVTAERFVCIVLPLKVKQIFTSSRTKVIIGFVYFLIFLSLVPISIIFHFGDQLCTNSNETQLTQIEKNLTQQIGNIFFIIVLGRPISFSILICFTCLLVGALTRKRNRRDNATHNVQKSQMISKRDARAI
jgi:hypothetical protein